MVRHLGRRLQIDLFRFFDERIDDVGLASGVELLLHELVDVRTPRFRLHGGENRPPARRHVAHHGDVEIAIDRQRERSRNGRGGHHQDVRVQPFRSKRGALHHAEAMLLVDDGQAQRMKIHGALHQRVRAHHQMDVSRGQARQQIAPAQARGSREQLHVEARRLEESSQAQEVLLRQDFRGRHEGHLQAVLHGHQRRQQRDNRLACAHVALKQAVHRLRPLHVVDDFLQRRPLPVSEPERQDLPRGFADAIVHLDRHRLGFPPRRAPAHEHAELEQKELFENQAHLRGRPELIELVDRRARRRENALRAAPGAARAASCGREHRQEMDRPRSRAAAKSTSCTRRRCIFGVIAPAFSYTGTMRPVWMVAASSDVRRPSSPVVVAHRADPRRSLRSPDS